MHPFKQTDVRPTFKKIFTTPERNTTQISNDSRSTTPATLPSEMSRLFSLAAVGHISYPW